MNISDDFLAVAKNFAEIAINAINVINDNERRNELNFQISELQKEKDKKSLEIIRKTKGQYGFSKELLEKNQMDGLLDLDKRFREDVRVIEKSLSDKIVYDLQINHQNELTSRISIILSASEKWSSSIYYRGIMADEKNPSRIFVDLNLYLTLRRLSVDLNGLSSVKIQNILSNTKSNIIIEGGPGAGKTTISQFITVQIIRKEKAWSKKYKIPFVVRFRDFKYLEDSNYHYDNFYNFILSYFGIKIIIRSNKRKSDINTIENVKELGKKILFDLCQKNNLFIILDGFDEIPYTGLKNSFIKDISEFSALLVNSRMLLTSRTMVIFEKVQNSNSFEIAQLSDVQVKVFVRKWLKNDQLSEKLLKLLWNPTFNDLINRPLNLAVICALFEFDKELPDKPRNLNKRLLDLMLKDWDRVRDVERDSKYQKFPFDRKLEFLSMLAHMLTVKFKANTFTIANLKYCYEKIHDLFGLPSHELHDVLTEIESHNGLFIQCSYDAYEFSHKSIQEYLVAEHISRDTFIQDSVADLLDLSNELGIAASLVSNPNIFIAFLILNKFENKEISLEFAQTFIRKLIDEAPNFREDVVLGIALASLYTNILDSKLLDTQFEKLLNTLIDSNRNIKISIAKIQELYTLRKTESEVQYLKNQLVNGENIICELFLSKNVKYDTPLKMPERFKINEGMLKWYLLF
ncbi:MAG: NACHT domain-containing protein [Ferruginibacter sp.]